MGGHCGVELVHGPILASFGMQVKQKGTAVPRKPPPQGGKIGRVDLVDLAHFGVGPHSLPSPVVCVGCFEKKMGA